MCKLRGVLTVYDHKNNVDVETPMKGTTVEIRRTDTGAIAMDILNDRGNLEGSAYFRDAEALRVAVALV